MNLLTQGIEQKIVIPTELTKRLTVDGLPKVYKVYRVRLDYLYYNDRNDRIATWINKYKFENGIDAIDKSNLEAYNDIIQRFIEESNPKALVKTQENIKEIGQSEPGVVLTDGRIIDGNRRFTCLRRLSKLNTLKYNYFDTVILDREIEHNEKQIKMLELELQMGVDQRVDYNPIDRLVGIYQYIVENKLLTVKEYADSVKKKVSDINKEVEAAKLLVEYLEFIHAPKKFYIAREQKVDGPLIEICGAMKALKDDKRKPLMKAVSFANILMRPEGDMTRYVRDIKLIIREKKGLDEFLNDSMPSVKKLIEILPHSGSTTPDSIAKIKSNRDIKDGLSRSMEKASEKVKIKETKNRPLSYLTKAVDALKEIDMGVYTKLNQDQKNMFNEKFLELKSHCEKIEGDINVSKPKES